MLDTSVWLFILVAAAGNLFVIFLIIQAATKSKIMERHAIAQVKLLKLIAGKSGATEKEIEKEIRDAYYGN